MHIMSILARPDTIYTAFFQACCKNISFVKSLQEYFELLPSLRNKDVLVYLTTDVEQLVHLWANLIGYGSFVLWTCKIYTGRKLLLVDPAQGQFHR